jgi:hypothetical protein
LTPDDPTDHALAAIASIREHKDTPDVEADASASSETDAAASSESDPSEVKLEDSAPMLSPEADSERDDHDEIFVGHEVAEYDAPATVPETETETETAAEPENEPAGVEGYSRLGPGPLDAIRFRWTARRDDDGRYFVDETIGSSRPISSGPMPADEIIGFIDGRERAARERFAALKSEMTIARRDRLGHDDHADNEHVSSEA